MPCASFRIAQDFVVRTDRVLGSSDNSGLWLLTACMYNLVAADLEYTLKLGVQICDIRTPARLWMDQTKRTALFSYCWEQTQWIMGTSVFKDNTGHTNATLRWKEGNAWTVAILLSWLYLTSRAQGVRICPFSIPNIQHCKPHRRGRCFMLSGFMPDPQF